MSAALEVKNLNKSFLTGFLKKKKNVLKNINFAVPTGSVTGFVGVNGSGKTTTIKCLLRFIFADPSDNFFINFFGNSDFSLSIKQRIAYLPERPYLPEQLTAEEFLLFHWQLGQGLGNKEAFRSACKNVLERVNLPGEEKNMLRGFSKGMLQRIGLAQALLFKPDFLILDEPMSGLDPDGRRLVKNIIRDEHQRGATIFFSSHLLGDMDELCTDLVVIDKGEIHFSGIVENFTHAQTANSQIIYLDKMLKRVQITIAKSELQLKVSEIISQQGQILKVTPEEASIESVFTQRKWLSNK